MTLNPRTDNPTTTGWYVVLRRGTNRPITLWWDTKYSRFWLEGARRVDVVAWEPIQMPKEEL